MSAQVEATLLVDGLVDGVPSPGVYAARAGDPAYGWLDALVLSGDATLLGERYDPDGTKYLAVRIGSEPALTANMGGAIRIGREFFTTALRDYQDWEEKWWREGVQNAVDAGATEIECRVEETPEGMAVSIADNGRGMDRDVLLNKFLVLGGTTKPVGAGTRGGFGKAKELLVLPWLAWSIHTRDVRVVGAGLEYQTDPAPYRQGTELRVVMPKDQTTHASCAEAFIEKCYLPGVRFTVNGEPRRARFAVGEELRDFGGKAKLYYDKRSKKQGLFVRTMGLCMFQMYVSSAVQGALIVELTGSSVDLLTANRDGFRDYEVKRAVEQYVNELAADVSSALKAKKGIIRKKFEGNGKFRGAPPRELKAEVLNHLEELVPGGESRRGKVLSDAQVGTISEIVNRLGGGEGSVLVPEETSGSTLNMRPNGALAAAMLADTVLQGPTAVEAAVAQMSWEPDFFLVNEVEGFHVPKMFFPEGMTPGVKKLARAWAELCRFVLIQLGCSLPFGVGFIFSPDALAAYERDEHGERWLLLNPFRNPQDAGVEKPTKDRLYGLMTEDDINQVYASAIHECTHMADGVSYHDESFSSAFTRNVARTANKERQVKAIIKAIKARGPRAEGAPKARAPKVDRSVLPELTDLDLATVRQNKASDEPDRYLGFYSDDRYVDTSGTLEDMRRIADSYTTYEVRDPQGRPVYRSPQFSLPVQGAAPPRRQPGPTSAAGEPLAPLADEWLEHQRGLRAQRPTSEYTSFRNDSPSVWDSDSDLGSLQRRAESETGLASAADDYFEIRRPLDGAVVWRSSNFFDGYQPNRAPHLGPEDADPDELRVGAAHEMEHTDDPEVAQQIALDHLAEDPHYYSRLAACGIDGELTENPPGGGLYLEGPLGQGSPWTLHYGAESAVLSEFSAVALAARHDVPIGRDGRPGAIRAGQLGLDPSVYEEPLKLSKKAVALLAKAGVQLTPNGPSAVTPEFRAYIEQQRAARAAFVASVEQEMAARGVFVRPMRRVPGSFVSLTRSTREGVDWQITLWDGDPAGADATPTGHRDVVGPLATAAIELTGLVDTRPAALDANGTSLRALNAWLRRNLPGQVQVLSTQGDLVEIGPFPERLDLPAYLAALERAFPGARTHRDASGHVYVRLPSAGHRPNKSAAALEAERGQARVVRSEARFQVAKIRDRIAALDRDQRAALDRLNRFAKAARARTVIAPTTSAQGDRCYVASAEQQARSRVEVDAFYDSRRQAIRDRYEAEKAPLLQAIERTKDTAALRTGGARVAAKALARVRQQEARSESDSEVEADLDPGLLVVWRAVKRNFRATPQMSRTEAFLHWVEENPDEVTAILADRTAISDAELAAAQSSEAARAAIRDDIDETEPAEVVPGDLPDVPFN